MIYTTDTISFHVDFEATTETTSLALIAATDIDDAHVRFFADIVQISVELKFLRNDMARLTVSSLFVDCFD